LAFSLDKFVQWKFADGKKLDIKEVGASGFRHPWELSRAEISLGIVSKYLPDSATFLDIGAGDIYFAKLLSNKTSGKIYAVDTEFVDKKTGDGNIILSSNADNIEEESVDCVIMMDVLEHIDDTHTFIETALSKLKKGGVLFITVPAHQYLYSGHDIFLKHLRRYNKGSLLGELKPFSAQVEIKEIYYFYLSLFVLRFLGVMLRKMFGSGKDMSEGVGNWKFGERNPITMMIRLFLNADFRIGRILSHAGINLPGLSLCMVCRKKSV